MTLLLGQCKKFAKYFANSCQFSSSPTSWYFGCEHNLQLKYNELLCSIQVLLYQEDCKWKEICQCLNKGENKSTSV
jgi:hypothetical protein